MVFSAFTALLVLFSGLTSQAVNIWPDKMEPPVQLDDALKLARNKLNAIETDNVYCINATLLNGENDNTNMGYWLIGFSTELGNSYSVAVRMDQRISVRKVKEFRMKDINPWPSTITPPVTVEAALATAKDLIRKDSKKHFYCLNATLVTGSNDVINDGMWNFVFQTATNDPKLINVRMNGKTAIKDVNKLQQYDAE